MRNVLLLLELGMPPDLRMEATEGLPPETALDRDAEAEADAAEVNDEDNTEAEVDGDDDDDDA